MTKTIEGDESDNKNLPLVGENAELYGKRLSPEDAMILKADTELQALLKAAKSLLNKKSSVHNGKL